MANPNKKVFIKKPVIFQYVEENPIYGMRKDKNGNEVQMLVMVERIYHYKVNLGLYNELRDNGLQSWQFVSEED